MAGKRDSNFIVVGMGLSSVDGVTPIPITVDAATGRLRVVDSGCVSTIPVPRTNANRDANRESVIMGQDSTSNDAVPLTVAAANSGLMVDPN